MRKNKFGRLAEAASLLLSPVALLLTVETVARMSLTDAIQWMVLPESVNPLRFTYLWIVFACLFVYAAVNRIRWSVGLVIGGATMVSLLHAGKLVLLQQPLVPGDLKLIVMTVGIWSAAYFPFTWIQVLGFLSFLVLCLVFGRYLLPDWRLSAQRRLLLLVVAGAALFGLSRHVSLLASRMVPQERKLTTVWRPENNLGDRMRSMPGIQNPDFSTSFNYTSYGLIAGFLLNRNQTKQTPTAPSAADVNRAWANHTSGSDEAPINVRDQDQPHVVIVLSESFWDPTWLADVTIDPDPLPNFRRLAAGTNGCAFRTVSPIFGGYTCNAEFELLTGIAMATIPEGSVPHRHGFGEHVPSLPSVFRRERYDTVAVHPFLADFWNRNLIYPKIGFERFRHIGNFRHRDVKGKFVSDDATADEVIELLEAATEPTFLLAITMQNHSPYGDHRYGAVETQTVRATGPENQADAIRDYVHGIRDADAMLDKLTRRLAGLNRRVLLLFLGDHQPNLTPPGSEPGTRKQTIREEASALPMPSVTGKFQGVALLWSSRGAAPQPPPGPVSLAALPARILREAGVAVPPFFRLSESVFRAYPVLNWNWGVSADGSIQPFRQPLPAGLLRDYNIICQDILFGRNHSRAHLHETDGIHTEATNAIAPASYQ